MSEAKWASFLREFNDELLADENVSEWLPVEVVESGWLGFPGATAEDLVTLQSRLGVALPPTYLEFLATSNGWHTISWNSIELWPANEVCWLRDYDPEIIRIWTKGEDIPISDEEYFVYGDEQTTISIRPEYLQDMLAISSRDFANQDQLWLNPKVRFEDGEWEAWHFSTEFPGASRFRSFRELMGSERQAARNLRDV